MKRLQNRAIRAYICATNKLRILKEEGQGTTEYAILVGVLAVVAMIAIAAFRGKIAELWSEIESAVNAL